MRDRLTRPEVEPSSPRTGVTIVSRRALLVVLALVAGGCSRVSDTVVCGHCYCSAWMSRDFSHPVSCATLGRDIACCFADSS